MKIIKFNEGYWEDNREKWENDPQIWCVITGIKNFNDITIENNNPHNNCLCFSSEILAADYVIHYVNYFHKQKFEQFFDNDDGSRFFINANENDDYTDCLLYCQENNIDIKIVKGKYHTTPKVMKYL